ncbi:MAG: DUF4270 domain-containing protein [Sphingobacteriales bacterium]|nr:MAG: DUF4270 domain-containing protein [Sphingobacteriales bacterium]TAF80550.1 MAG: DUF4270 domain-containing protein [Sphingobacteriales bacterium]
MTIKNSSLLTMLISFFVFYSCKKNSTIGLDLENDIALNSLVVFDSTLTTQLVKEDSITTNYQTLNPLGYFTDPVFGTTEANIAAAITLPNNTGFTFNKSATLDSAVLVMPFAGFYGDSLNTTYKVQVQQLNENLYEEGSTPFYYNTKTWMHKNDILGFKTFKPNIKDSVTIANIRTGKPDTLKRVPAQLRITLDASTITNLILKADSAALSTNNQFSNYFKGLFISMDKAATSNNGGLFLLNTSTNNAATVDIFYKETKNAKTDTLQKSFTLSGNQGYVASQIKWDYTGKVIANEIGKVNSDNLYLKGLSGTKVKVTFPNIKNIKLLGNQVLVNRAQLIIKVVNGTQTPYAPMPLLKAYKLDIANRPQLLPDENPSDPRNLGPGYIGGLFNKANNEYVFNVTGYVQDLLSNKPDYGTFISTINYAIDQRTNAATVRRAIVGGGVGDYKMKLKVFYTNQQ